MKKLSYLIVLVLILGLALAGCTFLSNISQVPATEQSSINYLTKGLLSDLVGQWHFDCDALDSSGNGNDGMLHNFVSPHGWVPGMFGQALSFDGTDDYVEIANEPSLNITQGTWEAWIKFDALPSVAGHPMNPLAKANQYWIHGSFKDLDSNTTDAIVVKICVGGKRYCAKTNSDFIEVDVWYHVAGTYDGETLNLYVNGTLMDSNNDPSGTIDLKSYIMAVGTWSTRIDYFQGTIDEVRIWKVALSQDQLGFYGFNGLLPPYVETKAFKIGSSIPLKWYYTDAAGNVVDSSLAIPRVRITFVDATPPPPVTDADILVNDPGKSGLRYDIGTDKWIFNWQTKEGFTAGTYWIWITSAQTGQINGPFPIQLR